MSFAFRQIDLATATGQSVETIVARELAAQLVGNGYRVGTRWTVDSDNPNHLSDGVRTLAVYVDVDRKRPAGSRVNLIGSLDRSIFEGVREASLFRPPVIRASVALERGPIILANEARRRVLAKLDETIPAIRDRIARELERVSAKAATQARLRPAFRTDGHCTVPGIYGHAISNHDGTEVTVHVTVPAEVAAKVAALLAEERRPH
jgi:hypothetical protein